MRSFLDFIRKHHFVLLFVALEVISVLLLANSQNYHRQAVVNTANGVVGKVYGWGSGVADYFRLKNVNERLAEENAELRRQLAVVRDTSVAGHAVVGSDTLYDFVPARVVKNSVSQANNCIIIDKGSDDGVRPDMSVVSAEGIVGVVKDVSRHYASVISLLHGSSVVGIRFKSCQELGTLRWTTNNYRFAMVGDIPTHLKLQPGDTVVTSSYSYIFPEDLMVGVVEEFYDNSSGTFNSAKVRLATNFSTLRHVYVVNNRYGAELDSLASRF